MIYYRLFNKDYPTMLKHKEGCYYLNLRNLDDNEETAIAVFICSTHYFMMLTGYAPHLLHPLNLHYEEGLQIVEKANANNSNDIKINTM